MDKQELIAIAGEFSDVSPANRVETSIAIRPELAGMRMFERPLLGVADADDPVFEDLRRPEAIGPHFRVPRDWLPAAVSVISLFHPFTEPVILTNREDPEEPSPEWLHARIEGQAYINTAREHLVAALRDAGFAAEAPSRHPDFRAWRTAPGRGEDGTETPEFTSNWSERHVAYAAGLGTFGLSAGLITRCGTAGRFDSIVTSLRLEPDARPYARHDEYCTRCGACVRRCPVSAISLETGKSKIACSVVVNKMKIKYAPRYGCGKCNVAVPCERRIPKKTAPR